MTQLTIKDTQTSPKIISIVEAEVGKWYKVHSYVHNSDFNGEIGLLIKILWEEGAHQTHSLVTPDGRIFNNPGFVLQELTSVEITYK